MAEAKKKSGKGGAIFAVLAVLALGGGFAAGNVMKPAEVEAPKDEAETPEEHSEPHEVRAGLFAIQERGGDEPLIVSVTLTAQGEVPPRETIRSDVYGMIVAVSEMPVAMAGEFSPEAVASAMTAIAPQEAPWITSVSVRIPDVSDVEAESFQEGAAPEPQDAGGH